MWKTVNNYVYQAFMAEVTIFAWRRSGHCHRQRQYTPTSYIALNVDHENRNAWVSQILLLVCHRHHGSHAGGQEQSDFLCEIFFLLFGPPTWPPCHAVASQEWVVFLCFSNFYRYGASLHGPSGRRSSAINFWHFRLAHHYSVGVKLSLYISWACEIVHTFYNFPLLLGFFIRRSNKKCKNYPSSLANLLSITSANARAYSLFICPTCIPYTLSTRTAFLSAVDKTRNMEHSGTSRNIPEHSGTLIKTIKISKNIYIYIKNAEIT